MPAVLDAAVTTHTLAGVPLDWQDDAGNVWLVESLTGWGGADVRAELVERPAAHGTFTPSPLYGPMQLEIGGVIVAVSLQSRRQAEQQLSSLTSALSPAVLRVDEAPYSRQVTVWRSGRLQMVARGNTVRYTLPLVAPDPRRYDTALQSVSIGLPDNAVTGAGFPLVFPLGFGGAGVGGDVTVTNAGDAWSWPTLTITGPAQNPTVRNNTTGDQLSFQLTLAAGDQLVIDTLERTVLLGGLASRRSAVSAGSSWPMVVPGGNLFQFRSQVYDPAASLQVRVRSAWY